MKHGEVGQGECVERRLDEAVAVDHGTADAAADADAATDAARRRRRLREGRRRRRERVLGNPAASSSSIQLNFSIFASQSCLCILLYKKVKTRLRDPASQLPPVTGARSRNLGYTF